MLYNVSEAREKEISAVFMACAIFQYSQAVPLKQHTTKSEATIKSLNVQGNPFTALRYTHSWSNQSTFIHFWMNVILLLWLPSVQMLSGFLLQFSNHDFLGIKGKSIVQLEPKEPK